MWTTFVAFLRMIKFSHTVFALPFALIGALLAARGLPQPAALLWIVAAMVGARTAAMGFNRLVDAHFDAANPRTANREIPSGKISRQATWLLIGGAVALFLVACSRLNRTTLLFAPLVLAVTFGYSFAKRFTWSSHLVLGAALALSPIGGYLGTVGTLAGYPGWLSIGVLFWVAGFDTLYACMDVEFDRGAGLHSLPALVGRRHAFHLALAFHAIALTCFLLTGLVAELGGPYLVGLALVAPALGSQHLLIRPTDLRRIQASFFTMNGVVSLVLLAATSASLLP